MSDFYNRRVYDDSIVPSRDEILSIKLSFQGLVVPTIQFGNLPGFEACLAWLSDSDKTNYMNAKHEAGDTHALIQIPFGPPLYDEPNQPYNAQNFPALDWTNGGSYIDDRLTNLIQEVINNGFNKILLFLGGDGVDGQPIAMNHLDLLHSNILYNNFLYKYCIVLPGWDGVFYGWEPTTKIQEFGKRFRSYWPSGYLGLEHSTGHIPLGEGGDDYLPGGRMKDFDIILSEYDQNLHQDSCWQINGRLERPYNRPSDQPQGDDPNPPYYLSAIGERGWFYHCAFEFGEYEFVRSGCSQQSVDIVKSGRNYLKSMGCRFTG